MKNFLAKFALVAALGLLCLAAPSVSAQTLTNQSPTKPDACSTANAVNAVNTQTTLTLTPPNGQYVYLCGLDVIASEDATSTIQTQAKWTSTNIGGWSFTFSMPAPANLNTAQAFNWSIPVKASAAGTAVTIVSPAAAAHVAYSVNAYYYFAP